jgi:hypothetical protein
MLLKVLRGRYFSSHPSSTLEELNTSSLYLNFYHQCEQKQAKIQTVSISYLALGLGRLYNHYGLAFGNCFHLVTGQRFSAEQLGSFLKIEEVGKDILGVDFENVRNLRPGQRGGGAKVGRLKVNAD